MKKTKLVLGSLVAGAAALTTQAAIDVSPLTTAVGEETADVGTAIMTIGAGAVALFAIIFAIRKGIAIFRTVAK